MTLQEKIKAKLPGGDTGIVVRKSLCDICTPGMQCGLDVYVKDGAVIKVEGTPGYPCSDGRLCTKGAATRQYIYREDRIRTPLLRVGGALRPVSWDDAYGEIAERLLRIKREYGPEAVVFYTGYPKWYRPWLHRLAYSFGSPNYGTESSSCSSSTKMAWLSTVGINCKPDIARCNVFLGWGCNFYNNNYGPVAQLESLRERGGKVIIVDPRVTPTTQKLADLHLQLRPGSDGALALGMCRLMLREGWADVHAVPEYVFGLEELRACADPFTPDEVQRITGVGERQLREAAELIGQSGPTAGYSPAATITHHTNGFNNFRAYIAVLALSGNIDREGGMLPVHNSYIHTDCGFDTQERDFYMSRQPARARPALGAGRFPLWNRLMDECQMLDFSRHALEADPYPLKALVGFGLNDRMFPDTACFRRAVSALDFVVDADLFLTDFAREMADVVLPSCSSLERGELKGYPGGYLTCTTPAIDPLYASRPDAEIICDLARHLELDDGLLEGGYEATMRYLIGDLDVSLEELQDAELPARVPEKNMRPYRPGTLRSEGFPTPSGKVELYSNTIAELGRKNLNPLPVYADSAGPADPERYPFALITGVRLPHALHSRLHDVQWLRSLRPDACVDLHPEDAAKLGIGDGDEVALTTTSGQVWVKARLTATGMPGDLYLYHGYREANANQLIPADHLDPYSGFPGFRLVRCAVRKVGERR